MGACGVVGAIGPNQQTEEVVSELAKTWKQEDLKKHIKMLENEGGPELSSIMSMQDFEIKANYGGPVPGFLIKHASEDKRFGDMLLGKGLDCSSHEAKKDKNDDNSGGRGGEKDNNDSGNENEKDNNDGGNENEKDNNEGGDEKDNNNDDGNEKDNSEGENENENSIKGSGTAPLDNFRGETPKFSCCINIFGCSFKCRLYFERVDVNNSNSGTSNKGNGNANIGGSQREYSWRQALFIKFIEFIQEFYESKGKQLLLNWLQPASK